MTLLTGRYAVGECCFAEETPPVVSSTSPPGHLLLLPDRHAGRPRALWPLPQCCHQEEFHSMTPAPFHFPLSRGSKSGEVLTSKHCPGVNKRSDAGGDCRPASICMTDKTFWSSVNKAVGLGEAVLQTPS